MGEEEDKMEPAIFNKELTVRGARMQKHGGDDPIDCKSCVCHLKTDDHLFQCPRQPKFLQRIQSIIDEV